MGGNIQTCITWILTTVRSKTPLCRNILTLHALNVIHQVLPTTKAILLLNLAGQILVAFGI